MVTGFEILIVNIWPERWNIILSFLKLLVCLIRYQILAKLPWDIPYNRMATLCKTSRRSMLSSSTTMLRSVSVSPSLTQKSRSAALLHIWVQPLEIPGANMFINAGRTGLKLSWGVPKEVKAVFLSWKEGDIFSSICICMQPLEFKVFGRNMLWAYNAPVMQESWNQHHHWFRRFQKHSSAKHHSMTRIVRGESLLQNGAATRISSRSTFDKSHLEPLALQSVSQLMTTFEMN